jgi:hypothetical protein
MTLREIEVDSLFTIGDSMFVKTGSSGPGVKNPKIRLHRCCRVEQGSDGRVVQNRLSMHFADSTEINLVGVKHGWETTNFA